MEYENAWKGVGNLLKHHDLYLLAVLDIIFTGLNEDWAKAMKTLIFKRITDYCVLPTYQTALDIYSQFLKDVQILGSTQHRIMNELLASPSSNVPN